MKTVKFYPIGYIRNSVSKRKDMTSDGTPSAIDILPEYSKALYKIKDNSHLWILCYFHQADRNVLRICPKKISSASGKRGVFASRSPARPNPISLTSVKLISVKGRTLIIEHIDAIDKTPVLDIKPYSSRTDCIPHSLKHSHFCPAIKVRDRNAGGAKGNQNDPC